MTRLLNENLFNTPCFIIKTSEMPRAISIFSKTILGIEFLQNMGAPIPKIWKKGEVDANHILVSGSSSQNELYQVAPV